MSMIPGPTGTAASFPDGIIGSQRANVQTISATLVLTSTSNRLQLITPSGATRTVQLPTTGVLQGEEWILMNAAGSGQSLIVAASNGSTIVTLAPGESGRVVASVAAPVASSDWQTQVQGITLADGSVSVPSLRFTGASVDTGLYSPGTDQIAFSQNGVQTLLVSAAGAFTFGASGTAAGHLAQGSTSDSHVLRVRNNTNALRSDGLTISLANGNAGSGTLGSTAFLRCFNDGSGETRNSTERMVIRTDGDVYNVKNAYGATSDIALKENIRDARSYIEDLNLLRVVKYNRIDDPSNDHLGLIAQEVEAVFPGLVEGEEGSKGVKYSIINLMMLKTIQELSAKNDALEARLAALES